MKSWLFLDSLKFQYNNFWNNRNSVKWDFMNKSIHINSQSNKDAGRCVIIDPFYGTQSAHIVGYFTQNQA